MIGSASFILEYLMDCREECQLSDSEEEDTDSYDPYESDPKFKSKKELEDFMSGCDISKSDDIADEDIDYKSHIGIKKTCTCGQCEDIWSEDFEHICCHQTDR